MVEQVNRVGEAGRVAGKVNRVGEDEGGRASE